jgi:hypothetical protein
MAYIRSADKARRKGEKQGGGEGSGEWGDDLPKWREGCPWPAKLGPKRPRRTACDRL